ncbi:hypothetical protein PRZ48_005780 [Zasmidium cellare]|uniref:Uncharacterized protein n=1 Tax=Zasmidium cellare TaxID=395010 RepID=A0ABR0ELH7_ZASCE|nr:hypothetical protein PRZ48_005780 [Zasmidium cellare]
MSSSNRDSTASFSHLSNRASTTSTISKKGERKVILITGATGGIGRATAVAFARTGKYDLALHYNSANEEARHKLLYAINDVVSAVIDVALFQADLSSYDGVRRLHREVTEQFSGVDVLFSNAGASGGISGVSSLADVPIDVFEQTWRVNTGSSILLAQLCLPFMEQQGWGRVIFNSSVAALTGGVVGPHYASSKSALHGFVHWLGMNVAKKGVTVNAVAPALITDTAMLPRDEGSERNKSMADRIPVGRLGQPEEIAETVLWLANVGYVTRKIIGVDGGSYPF